MLDWILARLEEPSTWAAGGIGSALIHQSLSGPLADAVTNAASWICVALAIALKEKGKNNAPSTPNKPANPPPGRVQTK